MSDIVIGFGGTGAKIVQAFVMMAASGALKLQRPVKVLLVDQDKSNGNTLRTIETLETYQKVASLISSGGDGVSRPLGTAIETYPGMVWQPLPEQNEALGAYFNYDANSETRDRNSRLLEILYDRPQLFAPLNQGFLGNPNMGAPVFAKTVDFKQQPWRRVDEDMGQGQNEGGTRIVLCGSVFGGTGAAGIPNVAKLLRQRFEDKHPGLPQAKIILNLAMPYFSIRQVQGAAVQAAGKNFLPNAKAALKYYDAQGFLDYCSMYLVGEAGMIPIETPFLGGPGQANSAHPLEMFAACNIYDALKTHDNTKLSSKVILTKRRDEGEYTWDDLPVEDGDTGYIRARMGAFGRACFAFLMFQKLLENYQRNTLDKGSKWVRDFFPQPTDVHTEELQVTKRLAQAFLLWAGELDATAHYMVPAKKTKWFNSEVLVDGDPRKLNMHLRTITDKDAPKLDSVFGDKNKHEEFTERDLLYRLSNMKGAKGMGSFLATLYDLSGEKLKGFGMSQVATRGGR